MNLYITASVSDIGLRQFSFYLKVLGYEGIKNIVNHKEYKGINGGNAKRDITIKENKEFTN